MGGSKLIQVDCRLISTSNRDMQEAIKEKVFREDLYYRLNVVPIALPPLRERREDILPLAEYFLDRLCVENHKEKKRFAESAKRRLMEYNWPGNIRELANIIERSVVMDQSSLIEADHLYIESGRINSKPVEKAEGIGLKPFVGLTLAELEKRLIIETLHAQQDNRTKTAEVLGISIRTLRNKLHDYRAQSQQEA